VRKNGKLFFGKICTHIHPKSELFPTRKNLKKPKFSDVNAIAGSQGHLQAVSFKKSPEICAKNSDQQKPAILTGFIRCKTLIF